MQSLEAYAERRFVIIITLPLLTDYTQKDTKQKSCNQRAIFKIIQMQAKKESYDAEVEEEAFVWKTGYPTN